MSDAKLLAEVVEFLGDMPVDTSDHVAAVERVLAIVRDLAACEPVNESDDYQRCPLCKAHGWGVVHTATCPWRRAKEER